MNYPQNEAAPSTDQPQVIIQQKLAPPLVTYIILGVTVFVYVLQMLTQAGLFREPFIWLGQIIFGSSGMNALLAQGWGSNILLLLGAKIRILIVEGQYWRLFTPALLHANLVHIGFNMYALFAIGRSLEPQYGHARFSMLYLLGAFGGNTLSFLLSDGLSVGASTAIFGLIAANGVFIYQNRQIFGGRARAALQNILTILVINLAIGLSSSNIDNWGHLGGLLAGAAFAWFAGPVLGIEGVWPAYEVKDKRSISTALITAGIVAAIIAGLVIWGIGFYS